MTDDPDEVDDSEPEEAEEPEQDNGRAKRLVVSAGAAASHAWQSAANAPKLVTSRVVKWATATHPRQWVSLLVLAGLVETVAVLLLRFVVQRDFKLDWGNVPTWVGANLTAAAVALALLTSAVDRRDREAERQRERQERREREKSQARLVFVQAQGGAVRVTNFSDKPVFRLKVKSFASGPAGFLQRLRELSRPEALPKSVADLSVLKAGQTRSFELPGTPSDEDLADWAARTPTRRLLDSVAGTGRALPTVELRFTDAEGNLWRCSHYLDNEAEPVITRVVPRRS